MKAFYEKDWFDYANNKNQEIKKIIKKQDKEYILNINETEFLYFLYEKFKLEELILDSTHCPLKEPVEKIKYFQDKFYGNYKEKYYEFIIEYKFEGNKELFEIKPTTWTLTTNEIQVSDSTVSFKLEILNLDKTIFQEVI